MRGLGTPALLGRHLRSGTTGSLLVGLLVGVAVLATALAPRALTAVATEELRFQLRTASPVLIDLSASGRVGFRETSATGDVERLIGPMDSAIVHTPERLVDPLASAAGAGQWVAHMIADDATPPGERRLRLILDLALDLRFDERIRVLEGELPVAWRPDLDPESPIEVALSAAAVEAAGLEVGDVLDYRPAPLRLAAVYEPLDADDTYWRHQSGLLAPIVEAEPGVLPTIRSSAYLDPGSAIPLQDPFQNGRLQAWLPIDAEALAFSDAEEVATQVRELTSTDTFLPGGGQLEFRSGLPDALDRVRERVTAVSALLALSLSGLLGVLLAVVALGIRSVIARRAPALSLLAARGASGLQLRTAMALEGAIVALPPSAAALGLGGILLPGETDLAGWIVPALLALAPIVLFAALTSPRGLRPPRNDLRMRGSSRARVVVELGLVGLAVVSVWLLSRRGLVPSAAAVGIDPLLSATPLLLALAVCVVALRVYPAPLLGLQRLLRGRDGAVWVLGSARAVRDPALGFATALALVVGVSIVVFSTVFVTTVRQGLDTGARDAVGADLQVRAFVLDDAAVEAARAVPGVADAVTLTRVVGVPFVDGASETEVFLVIADTEALQRIRPDLPSLPAASGGRAPVLVSSDWSDRLGDDLELGDAAVAVAGTIPPTALPGMTRHWMLLDADSADALGLGLPEPERLLVSLDAAADPASVAPALDAAVAATQPQSVRGLVTVLDTASALRDARSPAIGSVEGALLLAAVVSLLLTVLTVVLASVSAAAARNRLLGVLRILGMSTPQLRGVLAWELGPLAITALVVGTGLGFGLARIVTSVLDLRPFVGGLSQPGPAVDPLAVAVALLVFLVTVVAAGAIAVALGRRLAPAGALRVGDA